MRTFIAIFLAIHVPLFIYPVLRLGDWLEADVLELGPFRARAPRDGGAGGAFDAAFGGDFA